MTAPSDRVDAAWRILADLGVTITDLRDDLRARRPMPTVAEYLPQVAAAAGPGARRTYGSYWARMGVLWGHRPLDEIAATDVEALRYEAAGSARSRRNSRSGRHAGEHIIAAARALFYRAIADGLIEPGASPAHQVAKPRRLPNTRRALTAGELAQINEAARAGGDDVVLDALILRLHTETACRRGGALALCLVDLDVHNGQVCLTEKGGTQRWQPITLDLARHLLALATARGAVLPSDALLRYRDGRPLTSRRYDHLWKRLGEQLLWVAAQGISTHWLRHTTLTWVERHFGYGIARAYAGHTDSTGPATTTYIKGQIHEVAAALASMTGQPHPLAAAAERTSPGGGQGGAVRPLRLQRPGASARPGLPRGSVVSPAGKASARPDLAFLVRAGLSACLDRLAARPGPEESYVDRPFIDRLAADYHVVAEVNAITVIDTTNTTPAESADQARIAFRAHGLLWCRDGS